MGTIPVRMGLRVAAGVAAGALFAFGGLGVLGGWNVYWKLVGGGDLGADVGGGIIVLGVLVARYAVLGQRLDWPSEWRADDQPSGWFWRRAWAMLFDLLMLSLVSLPVRAAANSLGFSLMYEVEQPVGLLGVADYLLRANTLGFLTAFAYFTLCESSPMQATVGKVLLGLRVTDRKGQRASLPRAATRFLAGILSAVPFGIGYLMVATDARKGLHDSLSNTMVVHVRPVSQVEMLLPARS